MCGLSFSGKTTLAKAVARIAGSEYVGLDSINEERGAEERPVVYDRTVPWSKWVARHLLQGL